MPPKNVGTWLSKGPRSAASYIASQVAEERIQSGLIGVNSELRVLWEWNTEHRLASCSFYDVLQKAKKASVEGIVAYQLAEEATGKSIDGATISTLQLACEFLDITLLDFLEVVPGTPIECSSARRRSVLD